VPGDRYGCSTVNASTGCAMFVCSMTVMSFAFPGISFSDIRSGTTGFAVYMLVTELTFLSENVFRAHGVSKFLSAYFDK
jgi:hypothetical protein